MAEKLESLKDIKKVAKAAKAVETTTEETTVRKAKKDKQGRAYATGRRKDAVARVWIKAGKGNITINEKSIDQYFARPVLKMIINQPFEVANRTGEFDVVCTVKAVVCLVKLVLSNTVFLVLLMFMSRNYVIA